MQAKFVTPAVVCVGEGGINALATVRSLGRRGVPVHVVALASSPQIAWLSRYCTGQTRIPELGALYEALRELRLDAPHRPVLFIDNDKMLKVLAPHAAELQQRFRPVEPLGRAAQFMDKAFQVRAATQAGIAVPRTWLPESWAELEAIGAQTRERLLAKPSPVRFTAGATPSFKAVVASSVAELGEQLRALVHSPADVLVQEYIEGADTCHYGTLCYRASSRDACFVLSVRKVRQTTLEAGIMAVGEVVDAPEVRELTVRLAEELDYRGVIHVEFKRSPADGRYYFIEWNARPPYFHSLGWKAGLDVAYLAYCDQVSPKDLDSVRLRHDARHCWINLHEDLKRLTKSPRLALRAATWRPYLGRSEWAVFALDDLRPWLRSMRQLGAWLLQGPRRMLRRRGSAEMTSAARERVIPAAGRR